MANTDTNNKVVVFCKHCNKKQTASIKMWHTVVCDTCNTIITSDKGIDKVNK